MHSHTLYQSQVHHTGWTPNVMDTHKWLKMIRNVAGHANGILFRLLWHLIEQGWRQRIAAAIEMPGTCRPTGKSYSFIRRLCLSSFSHSISRRVVTDVSLIPGSGSCWTRNGWSAVKESNPLFWPKTVFVSTFDLETLKIAFVETNKIQYLLLYQFGRADWLAWRSL